MMINTTEILNLIEKGNLTDVSSKTEIPKRTLDNYRYGQSRSLESAIELLEKLQNYIEEEKKMKLKNIKNWEYIWEFDDLGDHLNNGSFTNQEEFDWWEELADALAFLEEETEIDVLGLEVNELQDYIDIAEENDFEYHKKFKVLRDILDKDNNPIDSEAVIETNDFDEARKEYNKLVESIKLHDHKKNGASLMKLDEFDEYSTEMFYVYGE